MSRHHSTVSAVTFSRRELRDLAIAWVAMAVAFALFFGRPERVLGDLQFGGYLTLVSALTVGVGFLCHELAHKIVAVRFGQQAEFQADYGMLFVAIMSAIIGFIVAAPGAVYHRGRVTLRQQGLIAVAGPLTNIALVVLFLPAVIAGTGGVISELGAFGVVINAFLAAFNMIPYGPLDGKTVLRWHRGVFVGVLAGGVGLTIGALLFVGLPS